MKFVQYILIVVCSLNIALAQEAYSIFDKDGNKKTFKDLVKSTDQKSHIFFGELHDNAVAHALQLQLTEQLFKQHQKNLLIGMEMFESDTQLIIDEYFSGRINQKSFESEARIWSNYATDYKPILEFAKANGLTLVATNIPRRYANAVYHQGIQILENVSDEGKKYFPKLPIAVDTTLSSYKEMKNMIPGHNGDNMVASQAVKDATMAERIYTYSQPNSIFLHLNGAYHTNKWEGIISYLKPKIADDKIFVITTVEQSDLENLSSENKGLADYIICVPEKVK
ncbi:ChaN family lipoprotein [Sphingobacterium hungaricum]|uniref:Iron-regulated protein n=1 Tax=Sphingobacterium hungaricum TaxID=2082723 RepID=A0A928UZ78_9SPHI|nr:ChaN family lipoprotein [Sphingobacterium hungaricum]MBE8713769.1 iron-regulated protein [Sphingobacterium hungaricum]